MFIEYESILNDAGFKNFEFDHTDRIAKGRATFNSYFTMSESITGWKVNITDYHNYDYSWTVPVTGNYGLSTAVKETLTLIGELEEIVMMANRSNFYAPMHYADFSRYDRDVIIALSSPYGSVLKVCTTRTGNVGSVWVVLGGTPKMNTELKGIIRKVRGNDKCAY